MSLRRVSELSETQRDGLHELYRNEWWTETRERAEIDGMVDESDEIVAFCVPETKRLVAFARVLTDYTYKALVFDVIVATEYRGTGLGERVMDTIIDHPALSAVEHVELYCLDDVVGFYEQWGFSRTRSDLQLLRLDR